MSSHLNPHHLFAELKQKYEEVTPLEITQVMKTCGNDRRKCQEALEKLSDKYLYSQTSSTDSAKSEQISGQFQNNLVIGRGGADTRERHNSGGSHLGATHSHQTHLIHSQSVPYRGQIIGYGQQPPHTPPPNTAPIHGHPFQPQFMFNNQQYVMNDPHYGGQGDQGAPMPVATGSSNVQDVPYQNVAPPIPCNNKKKHEYVNVGVGQQVCEYVNVSSEPSDEPPPVPPQTYKTLLERQTGPQPHMQFQTHTGKNITITMNPGSGKPEDGGIHQPVQHFRPSSSPNRTGAPVWVREHPYPGTPQLLALQQQQQHGNVRWVDQQTPSHVAPNKPTSFKQGFPASSGYPGQQTPSPINPGHFPSAKQSPGTPPRNHPPFDFTRPMHGGAVSNIKSPSSHQPQMAFDVPGHGNSPPQYPPSHTNRSPSANTFSSQVTVQIKNPHMDVTPGSPVVDAPHVGYPGYPLTQQRLHHQNSASSSSPGTPTSYPQHLHNIGVGYPYGMELPHGHVYPHVPNYPHGQVPGYPQLAWPATPIAQQNAGRQNPPDLLGDDPAVGALQPPVLQPQTTPDSQPSSILFPGIYPGGDARPRSGSIEDTQYIHSLLEYQHQQRDKVLADVKSNEEVLGALKRDIVELDRKLMQKKRTRTGSAVTAEDIQKIREENVRLQSSIHLLSRQIYAINAEAILGNVEEQQQQQGGVHGFYNRMSVGPSDSLTRQDAEHLRIAMRNQSPPSQQQPVAVPPTRPSAPPARPPPPRGPPPREVPQPIGEEELSWSCNACTFKNHSALEHCEMCEMPRCGFTTLSSYHRGYDLVDAST